MDPNFAAIQKALLRLNRSIWQDRSRLKITSERVGRIECKTIEDVSDNESWPENNTPRRAVQPDNDEINLKHIKLEAPTFDGQLDPQVFLDWTANIDHYFNWYNMSDERRIRFAKMKLIGHDRQYWTTVEKLMSFKRQKPIQTWDEMKLKLQEKYLFILYKQHLLDK